MESDEFYVYPGGTYFTCGGCGSSLSPFDPNRRPYKPKVCCYNPGCLKYLHVLVIGDEHRIIAFDTGERAPDPARAMQNARNEVMQIGAGRGGTLAYDPADRTIRPTIADLERVLATPDTIVNIDPQGNVTTGT